MHTSIFLHVMQACVHGSVLQHTHVFGVVMNSKGDGKRKGDDTRAWQSFLFFLFFFLFFIFFFSLCSLSWRATYDPMGY